MPHKLITNLINMMKIGFPPHQLKVYFEERIKFLWHQKRWIKFIAPESLTYAECYYLSYYLRKCQHFVLSSLRFVLIKYMRMKREDLCYSRTRSHLMQKKQHFQWFAIVIRVKMSVYLDTIKGQDFSFCKDRTRRGRRRKRSK